MDVVISFSIQLNIANFADEAQAPTTSVPDFIAQPIRDAVEHYRANAGLTDANSDIRVPSVASVNVQTG